MSNVIQFKKKPIERRNENQTVISGILVSFCTITPLQAKQIIARSHRLYEHMQEAQEKILSFYDEHLLKKLMNDFHEIIAYSELLQGNEPHYLKCFDILQSFLGKIENIIKIIRYY
jgi:hypothetical protein